MTPKAHQPLRALACPDCKLKGNLQRIIYGMPDPETFDFEKYAVGGCLVEDNQPDIRCRDCGWSGLKAFLLT
jgi:DNA-directed RNA polymerase subunit RPC12/RpoP